MKKELLPGVGPKEVRDKALEVISAIIRRLSDDIQHQDIILNKIFTNTIGTLLNRDSTLYKPTMELVLKCAEATDESCLYVTRKVFPIVVTDLTANEELSDTEKCEVLEDYRKLILIVEDRVQLNGFANDSYMLLIQKELMKVLMSHSSIDVTKATLKILSIISGIINDENRQIVYQNLSSNLGSATPEHVQCLVAFGKIYPNEVFKEVLAPFMEVTYSDPDVARALFPSLAKLLDVPDLREHIIEFMCLNVFSSKSISVQLVVLEVFNNVLSTSTSSDIARNLYNEWRIVIKLMDLIKNENVELGQEVVYQASLVMNLVIRTLPNSEQIALIEKYLPYMKLNESIPDLYVTSGLLGFLDPSVPLDGHFESLVNDLTKLSLTSNDETVRKLANQLLCSLFNRAPVDERHRKILRKVIDLLKDEIKKNNHKAVEILGWISKGLLARGHPDAAEILETIAELLDHPKLSKAAELAFEIISMEFPHLHLPLLKHLFKQKIFVLAMKFLDGKIEKLGENHLTAMAHVLQITPHQVLKMNIEKVGPILMKCIQTKADDPHPHSKRIRLSLKIINHFILEKNQFIVQHLQHLVKDLLVLTQFKPSMDVRILALKCLEHLTKFPLFTLVPYKNDVTHELQEALDDPKRLVRTAAVSARMSWFLLGDEGIETGTSK